MKKKFDFCELIEYSLNTLHVLEHVNKKKIESLQEVMMQLPNGSFSSLLNTMKQEQELEYDSIIDLLKVNVVLKEKLCNQK